MINIDSFIAGFLVLSGLISPVQQQEKHAPSSAIVVDATTPDLEIDGLVVDETQTKLGHDFYEIFYSQWETPRNSKDFTIVIKEKPLPRIGTQVTIEIHEKPIFIRFLQPRFDAIEETAKQGVHFAEQYLFNFEEIKRNLESEDLHGSGI
ncbi:MAG: hypothetical protein DWQ05_21245 [Calditrichaeota bacterium]|nr:MAG: hypothetical protein DWQ05_21245 [Calditrichota bacterium]